MVVFRGARTAAGAAATSDHAAAALDASLASEGKSLTHSILCDRVALQRLRPL